MPRLGSAQVVDLEINENVATFVRGPFRNRR